jgi:hypothetical protein
LSSPESHIGVFSMKKEDIKEHIDKGYILVRVMFEVLGSPKEHVAKSLREYISTIKNDPRIIVISEEYAEPVENEKLWSTFCEAEFLVLGLEKLSWLAINFTPASMEIVEPATLTYRNKDITHWVNDILSRLHEIGIASKAVNQKHAQMERNLSVVVRNCILALLTEEKTQKELSKEIGIPEENMQSFLNALEAEGKVIAKGKKYARNHGKK